jgi:hypothetical protein
MPEVVIAAVALTTDLFDPGDGKTFGCPDLLTDFVRSAAQGNHLESFPESAQLERHGMIYDAYNRTGQAILFRQSQPANTANQQSI